MKITALETVRVQDFPNILWVRIHTDEGLVGLGETFFMAQTVESYIHEVAAPKLLGRDPLEIDRISRDLTGYLGFRSTGVETRGNSAIDIGLWDLFGHATGLYGIRGAETARTQIGASNPAAGIDARTNHEAQMKAGGRGIKARDIR